MRCKNHQIILHWGRLVGTQEWHGLLQQMPRPSVAGKVTNKKATVDRCLPNIYRYVSQARPKH